VFIIYNKNPEKTIAGFFMHWIALRTCQPFAQQMVGSRAALRVTSARASISFLDLQ
jgi:hypothetical protein